MARRQWPRAGRHPRRTRRRLRLLGALAAVSLLAGILVGVLSGGSMPAPPRPQAAAAGSVGRLFDYVPSRASDYSARASVGNAHPLFAMSPGGAIATAARVARYRPLIDRATAGTGIDPNLLEGLVFVESAGRPQVVVGSNLADAAGLTQILAATGTSLLGMHIDLAASQRLSGQIAAVQDGSRRGNLGRLLARRAAVDERFDPARALAATVRYLRLAEGQFGREDLAFESYHMGVGNLHQVLADYDRGAAVPYVQLYFDSTPLRHASTHRLLAGFGDDSDLYWWRILGAEQVMRLYRSDRAALRRLTDLEGQDDAGGVVLHPPGHTAYYARPDALAAAYQHNTIVPLPRNAARLGIAPAAGMGGGASRVGAPRALYAGLRPGALRVLLDMAAAVRRLSHDRAPLQVISTVADERYQRTVMGGVYPPAATGWSFAIGRRYANTAQADALQAVLDRLQSLNLIAWAREPNEIQVTVASGAAAYLDR